MSNIDINILALSSKRIIELYVAIQNDNLDTYLKENNLDSLTSIRSLSHQVKMRMNQLKTTPIAKENELSEDLSFINNLIKPKVKSRKESVLAVLNNLKNNI